MYHAAGTMRRPEPATALLLLGIFTVSLLPPAATRAAAADTWDLRQISADERRRVIGGEIVPFTVAERTDRDLAAGAMMFLPLPVPRVGDYLAESELAVRDPGVVSWGALPERAEAASLAKLRLSPAEADELLDARPGSVWNLSGAEMEALRAMRSMLPAASRTLQAESVSAQYRAILLRRTQAYRAGGLDAIDPYARRGGTTADPAAELRLAAEDARAHRCGPLCGRWSIRFAPAELMIIPECYGFRGRVIWSSGQPNLFRPSAILRRPYPRQLHREGWRRRDR